MGRSYTVLAIGAGVLVLAAIVYLWQKGLAGAARGAVNAASDLVGGTVVGVGDAIGIPATNMTECQQLLAAGRYWDASFKCPAGTLIKGLFGDTPAAIPSSPTVMAEAPAF